MSTIEKRKNELAVAKQRETEAWTLRQRLALQYHDADVAWARARVGVMQIEDELRTLSFEKDPETWRAVT